MTENTDKESRWFPHFEREGARAGATADEGEESSRRQSWLGDFPHWLRRALVSQTHDLASFPAFYRSRAALAQNSACAVAR